MTEAVATTTGTTLASRYTLLEKLGAGGQGEVWRAHDGTRGVDIALKVVKPVPGREEEAWKALEHEHAIASKLDHPSILKLFPPERLSDTLVLPMELASGGDLRRLRGAGFLEIIPVLLEIAQALEHAHERGVVHRDLKPGNVLFDARGRARLADFGVAEQAMTSAEANSAGFSSPASRDTNRHGFSPFTASPAQLRGEPPTPSDDIYGLGALAYELLSGYPPYYPHFDKKRAIEERVPTLVPTRQIPPLLGTLVMNMLAKDAKRRPRTIREVIDELDASINDTLTYDFDNVSPATPTASVAIQAAAQASARPAAWTPEEGDRRANNDKRGRRKEDLTPPASDRSDAGVENAGAIRPGEATSGRRVNALKLREPTILSPRTGAHLSEANIPAAPGADPKAAGVQEGERRAGTVNSDASNAVYDGRTVELPRLDLTKFNPDGLDPDIFEADDAPESDSSSSRSGSDGNRRDTGQRRHNIDADHPSSGSGSDVLARIDAALGRSGADTGSRPKLGRSGPMTPERAAAIVAAARAASTDPVLSRAPSQPPPSDKRDRPASSAGSSISSGSGAFAAPASLRSSPTTTHLLPPDTVPKMVPASALPQPEPVDAAATSKLRLNAATPTANDAHTTAITSDISSGTAAGAAPGTQSQPQIQSSSHYWPRVRNRTQRNRTAEHAGSGSQSAASPEQAGRSAGAQAQEHPPGAQAAPSGGQVHPQASGFLYPTGTYRSGIHVESMSANMGPMHPTWDIPLDGLPKIARLQPIKPRRWPWVFLGLLAGAAAVVYFWLPRFDMRSLPPEVASVLAPLQAELTQSPSSQAATATSPTATEAQSDTRAAQTPLAGQDEAAGRPSPAASAFAPRASMSGASTPDALPSGTSTSGASSSGTDKSTSSATDEQRLRDMRKLFDTRVAALEARGAGVWGGREFALAKTRSAESVGANDAGNPRVAQERLAAGLRLLDIVESRASQALSTQVAAGEKALSAGQQEVAGQAFELARRINPSDRRATDGQRRARNLNAVLPLLADAQNAESAHDYARAAQDFSQALSLDPGNTTARAGQARANAAFGDDNYAKAVGSGFAALGAGRLDEAHDAFVKARALKPGGAEAAEGLRRVSAALAARGFASMRQRALGFETQERWEEAEHVYEDVLAADPSLAFAQEGKARTSSRADLSVRLQQYLDRPDRLSTPSVRNDARALLETALAQSPQGPVIRSQIARLEVLLPSFDKPVRLSLVSDNSTQIVIPSIGSFGTFARRDIELRPGKYIVVGTRNGFRDVRREITVAPGQETQTIRVTCSDPI